MFRSISALLILISISCTSIAQDTIHIFTPHNELYTHHTDVKDSLFIYNNSMGRLTRTIWINDPIDNDGHQPVIVMVPNIITLFKKIEQYRYARTESNLTN